MATRISEFDYLKGMLEAGSNPESRSSLIDREVDTLHPYFTSLAARLSSGSQSSPAKLQNIFKELAKRNGSFISSGFHTISGEMVRELSGSAQEDLSFFYRTTSLMKSSITLGFVQSKSASRQENYSVPVLGLDSNILIMLQEHSPKLVSLLEELYTFANHDYLHHLTAAGINSDIAETKRTRQRSNIAGKFMANFGLDDDEELDSYESFMLESHAVSFRDRLKKDSEFSTLYFSTLDNFFSELKKARDGLLAGGSPMAEYRAKEIVDYVGHAAIFSMMRLFRMNERPIIDALKRIDRLDPDKDLILSSARIKKRASEIRDMAPHIAALMNKVFASDDNTILLNQRRAHLENLMVDCVIDDIDLAGQSLKGIEERLKQYEAATLASSAFSIDNLFNGLNQDLAAAADLISENGRVTHDTIEIMALRIEKARVELNIRNARHDFEKLMGSDLATIHSIFDIDNLVKKITDFLDSAGQDASALDPSGNASAQEMQQRLHQALSNFYVSKARDDLSRFEDKRLHDTYTLKAFLPNLRSLLEKARADVSALDPSGTATMKEMESRLADIVAKACLDFARDQFSRLENARAGYDAHGIAMTEKNIREHLGNAGRGLDALDPAGQATAEDMETRLVSAVANAHLTSARDNIERFENSETVKDAGSIDFTVKNIYRHLSAAGLDDNSLDQDRVSLFASLKARIDKAKEKAWEKAVSNENNERSDRSFNFIASGKIAKASLHDLFDTTPARGARFESPWIHNKEFGLSFK